MVNNLNQIVPTKLVSELVSLVPSENRDTFLTILDLGIGCIRRKGDKYVVINRTDIPFSIRRKLSPYLPMLVDVANAGLNNEVNYAKELWQKFMESVQQDINSLNQVTNMLMLPGAKTVDVQSESS